MRKQIFILLTLIVSSSLFSTDLKLYMTTGNFGMEDVHMGYNSDNIYLSLPSIHLRDYDSNIGLSLEGVRFNNAFSKSDFNATFFKTTLYWSPIKINRYSIVGPFIDVDFNFDSGVELSSDIGARFSLLHSVSRIFPEFIAPESLLINTLNIETGYSLTDRDYFFRVSTDLSFFGLMFVKDNS